jgi:uncharacterized membrane protein YhdT
VISALAAVTVPFPVAIIGWLGASCIALVVLCVVLAYVITVVYDD